MEATSVTGPAKNLINFCRWARSPEAVAHGLAFSLSVGTFCRNPAEGNEFIRALRDESIPVHIIGERYRFDRAVVPELARIVGQLDPHIVQTHMVKSHFLFRSTGLHRSRIWLAFQHGYTATDLKGRLYNQLDRWSLRSADRVVSVCEAFVPRLMSYGVERSRVRILHNSVRPAASLDVSAREQLRTNLALGRDEKIILSIGRFSKEKGHSDLIQALGILHRTDPLAAWKAVLVGAGPELPNLQRLVADHSLENRVVFAGFHRDTSAFYANADVFVLPSLSEGSPNVLLEAMAARVPVAATRAGGIPEIAIDEVTGLLTLVGDSIGLSESLRRLLADRSLRQRLAEAGFARVQERFSPERYLESLAAIYTEVLTH